MLQIFNQVLKVIRENKVYQEKMEKLVKMVYKDLLDLQDQLEKTDQYQKLGTRHKFDII
jgi:hypothetical protein